MKSPVAGTWLGIDIGSSKAKVCSLCLVESDGQGRIEITFERGPGGDDYPATNTRGAFLDPNRPPTYLKEAVEKAVRGVLDRSNLVGRWLTGPPGGTTAVAVDAPVALALEGSKRLTEAASTDVFDSPDEATFEHDLATKKDPFLRINVFWKCVGFAVYRHLARLVTADGQIPSQRDLAAWTCPSDASDSGLETTRHCGRLRETFPSDVYKRSSGRDGRIHEARTLSPEALGVLRALVAPATPWEGAAGPGAPAPQTLAKLRGIQQSLHLALESGPDRSCEMRKRPGTVGDLWDAFTCAFVACCEDHGGAVFHGLPEDRQTLARFRQEGAILTVAAHPVR